MPYSLDGAALVSEVRHISRVLREEAPVPGLEIVDYLVPVADRLVVAQLEDSLDHRFGAGDLVGMSLVPPASRGADWERAQRFRIRFGRQRREMEHIAVGDIGALLTSEKDNRRIHSLRTMKIDLMAADECAPGPLVTLSADKCLEAAAALGSHRYFLMEGQWYELDAAHLSTRQAVVESLFKIAPSIDLPAWDRRRHKDERDYNAWVPTKRDGYVCLDRRFVRTAAHPQLEVCDLFAPDDTLVLVKRAASARELSHLFMQAVTAVDALVASADARAAFAELVDVYGRGRTIRIDFVPKKLVLAILADGDRRLSAETLFPFSMIGLAKIANHLREQGIELEIVDIAPLSDS